MGDAGRHPIVDIRDVKPPVSITTVFLHSLAINLNFTDDPGFGDKATSISEADTALVRKRAIKLPISCSNTQLEYALHQDSGNILPTDVRQVKITTGTQIFVTAKDICDRMHLITKALAHIFKPRVTKSIDYPESYCRNDIAHLTDIIPAAFDPGLPQILKPRQGLIPAIAQCLAIFDKNSARVESYEDQDIAHACTSLCDQNCLEEHLWACMLSAPMVKSRVRVSLRHHHKNNEARDQQPKDRQTRDDLKTLVSLSTEKSSTLQDGALVDATEYDFRKTIDQDEMMLEHEITTAVPHGEIGKQCLLPRTSNVFRHFHPTEDNAITRAHSQFVEGCDDQKNLSTVGSVFRLDDYYAHELLTHVDEYGIGPPLSNEFDDPQDLIGPKWLIHDAYSTQLDWANRNENPSEDMIELVDKPCLLKDSISIPSSPPLINCEVFAQLIDNSDLSISTMPKGNERHSLSEVLGDDQWLWNMWKRRKSTAIPTEEEMRDMFKYDPDMRVFSKDKYDDLEEEECADSPSFDSFDFSRQSSSNDIVHSPNSDISGNWDSFPGSPVLNQNGRTTTSINSPMSPSRETKGHKRRPSLFRLSSRTANYGENDIQLQQRNSTRDVHIKKRKSLNGY